MGRAEGEIQSFGEQVGSRINIIEWDPQHVDQDLPVRAHILNQWFSSHVFPLSLANFFFRFVEIARGILKPSAALCHPFLSAVLQSKILSFLSKNVKALWKWNVVPFHVKTRSPTAAVIGHRVVIEELNTSWLALGFRRYEIKFWQCSWFTLWHWTPGSVHSLTGKKEIIYEMSTE